MNAVSGMLDETPRDGEVFLQVVDLYKDFGKTKVVKGVTTQFRRGELVSIIGPSGSGKSTFLRCLNLLEQPTSGKLIFDGVDLLGKGVNINEHRQKIGMVFQQFNLFNNMNVIRNLTMAPTTIKGMDPTEAEVQVVGAGGTERARKSLSPRVIRGTETARRYRAFLDDGT